MHAANDNDAHCETLFEPAPDMARAFRDALGSFATGVTVVTAMGPAGPMGMTVNSFASVSLDPPLVLWSSAKSASRHGSFTATEHFAIHVLTADQDDLCARFIRGGSAFDGLGWRRNAEGAPIIPGTLARFECRTATLHDAGDHTIMIGRVLRVAHRAGEPLCFSQGGFRRFA